jgi:hypothetical protein
MGIDAAAETATRPGSFHAGKDPIAARSRRVYTRFMNLLLLFVILILLFGGGGFYFGGPYYGGGGLGLVLLILLIVFLMGGLRGKSP